MFTDKERAIFKYHNGEVDLFGDPLALERRLRMACKCDPAMLTDKMQPDSPPEEYWTAQEKLVAAIRAAFGMIVFDPLTGKGARDEDCLKVWNSFWEWMGAQKKSTSNSPTTLPSMAYSPFFDRRSTTTPTSASPSTPNGR